MIELLFGEEDIHTNTPGALPSPWCVLPSDNQEPCDAVRHASEGVIDDAGRVSRRWGEGTGEGSSTPAES